MAGITRVAELIESMQKPVAVSRLDGSIDLRERRVAHLGDELADRDRFEDGIEFCGCIEVELVKQYSRE